MARNGQVPATVVWILAWGLGGGALVMSIVHLTRGDYFDALFQAGVGVVAWSVLLTLYNVWDSVTWDLTDDSTDRTAEESEPG